MPPTNPLREGTRGPTEKAVLALVREQADVPIVIEHALYLLAREIDQLKEERS